jgi:hypothetical protein
MHFLLSLSRYYKFQLFLEKLKNKHVDRFEESVLKYIQYILYNIRENGKNL